MEWKWSIMKLPDDGTRPFLSIIFSCFSHADSAYHEGSCRVSEASRRARNFSLEFYLYSTAAHVRIAIHGRQMPCQAPRIKVPSLCAPSYLGLLASRGKRNSKRGHGGSKLRAGPTRNKDMEARNLRGLLHVWVSDLCTVHGEPEHQV